jgi:hypothetical protein
VDISFTDDVTDILLLGVSFISMKNGLPTEYMVEKKEGEHLSSQLWSVHCNFVRAMVIG